MEVQRAKALSGRLFRFAIKFLNSVKFNIWSLSLSNFLKQASTCSGVRFGNDLAKSFLVTKPSLSLSRASKEALTRFKALLIVSSLDILGGPLRL